jgi:hypothetical protein
MSGGLKLRVQCIQILENLSGPEEAVEVIADKTRGGK